MPPSATNIDSPTSASLPDEVSKPPPGVVLPPRDVRAIVEKTAGYVVRNGPVFEERIREKEKHNPKFSFLSPNDAYSAYYAWRLAEIKEGRGTAISAGRVGEIAIVPEPEKAQGPPAPPEFKFSARMPNISAQDLEVVGLTALFVAKNGRSFMTTLSQKESRNYQFDFLRPQHSFHQFFSRLVDQYTVLLQAASAEGAKPQRARIEELENNIKDRFKILGRAAQRSEWVKFQEEQKQKKEEEAAKEKVEYAQIDWHDFVLVETILFEEADDQADLPAPTSLNDLQCASLEQKAAMSLQPHDRRIEEAMPTSEDYDLFYHNQTQQAQAYAMSPPASAPMPPPSSNIIPYGAEMQQQQQQAMDYQYSQPHASTSQEEEEERAIAERMEARKHTEAAQAAAKGGAGQMRIRNDYVPRAQAKRKNVQMALCPNCNQQIPFDELDQHMRSKLPSTPQKILFSTFPLCPHPCIPPPLAKQQKSKKPTNPLFPSIVELLDPRWKEQRAKSDQRQSLTNLSTSDVAANLKRLRSQRSDVFEGPTTTLSSSTSASTTIPPGMDQLELSEQARKKFRAAGPTNNGLPILPLPPVSSMGGGGKDGGGGSGMQGLNIEEQIRQIHQKFKSPT